MDELVLVALIGLSAGLVKGISGFGSSLVTIPLLTIVYGVGRIDEIVIMMITFNVVLNLLLMFENKAFHLNSLKGILPITITGAIFTFIGLYYLQDLDENTIKIIAGCLILLAILVTSYNLFVKNKIHMKPNVFVQVIVGVLSGLGNGIASIDGPPVVFYLTSVNSNKVEFKNTLATHFLVMGIIGVISILIQGLYTTTILLNTGFILIFTVVGLLIGMVISKRTNERNFQIIVLLILVGLIVRLIFF